jgi:hypothetical protein
VIICVDVKCPSGHVNEVFIDSNSKNTDCPQEGCTEVAERIISPVRSKLDPCSGDFPGATMKWIAGRERQMARERKAVEQHGQGAEWDVARSKDFIR